MKVEIEYRREAVVRLCIALVLAGVLYGKVGFSVWALPLFGALYFLIQSLRIQVGPRAAVPVAGVLLAASAIVTTCLVQFLLLEAEDFGKLSRGKLWLNIICCLVVFLVAQAVANNTGLACTGAHLFLMALAGVDYFVFLFRGNEFIFSDLRSIMTGLSVAANYDFVLSKRAAYALLLTAVYIALVRRLQISFTERILMTVVCLSFAVLGGVYVVGKSARVVTETWEQKGSTRNGYLLNFVLSIRDCFVSAPDGYSAEAIEVLEARYGDAEGGGAESEKYPTILVIMSESYADLSVVGKLSTNVEVTPFYDSLTENTRKGYALASVFGAKTPNSEWEFLTGNSMAFLPGGSVVYQQYLAKQPVSIVPDLKSLGYTCVMMHPYYATGWSRNTVYPRFGFDEMHFIEAFDGTALLRKYVTDQEFYEKVVERFEQKDPNEPLFLMGISMQNHGGYTEQYSNFTQQVRMTDADFPAVNQYLSLLRESDAALEYLIAYFSQVDEPVEIVFFGDHQPSLTSRFYPYLNGKGLSGLTLGELEKLYTVPFFIWTNYESEERDGELTSLNYLSSMALEGAGIEPFAYNRFLLDLQEAIPAINSRGYYSKSEGGFRHVEDAEGEEAQWLKEYAVLQYNNMFDRKGRSKVFFD